MKNYCLLLIIIGVIQATFPMASWAGKCYSIIQSKANKGNSKAQYIVALHYAGGIGVQQNYRKAVYWLRLAANQGYNKAESFLGSLYYSGQGVPKDSTKATYWWELAANQTTASIGNDIPTILYNAKMGNPEAQDYMGTFYETGGKIIRKDYLTAVHWYRLAARQGYSHAQVSLGLLYAQGHGVLQDQSRAFHWYHMAALQGNGLALKILGDMYFSLGTEGGGRLDYVDAEKWYLLAGEFGYSNASMLRFVQASITPDQNAEANRLADQWCTTHEFNNLDP